MNGFNSLVYLSGPENAADFRTYRDGGFAAGCPSDFRLLWLVLQEAQRQGLNLKMSVFELSRHGTSSIEAHSSEEGTVAGTCATAAQISVLRCLEWGVDFSFEASIASVDSIQECVIC